jgi:hypothetical protein
LKNRVSAQEGGEEGHEVVGDLRVVRREEREVVGIGPTPRTGFSTNRRLAVVSQVLLLGGEGGRGGGRWGLSVRLSGRVCTGTTPGGSPVVQVGVDGAKFASSRKLPNLHLRREKGRSHKISGQWGGEKGEGCGAIVPPVTYLVGAKGAAEVEEEAGMR